MTRNFESLEKLRLEFKPQKITLLLVGESPPPNRGFFYDVTAAEGQLSRNTRRVFQDFYEQDYASREEFLTDFKMKECYLVDLFPQRGKTPHNALFEERAAAVKQLADLLKAEQPRVIASVLKRIQRLVEQAIAESRVPVSYRSLCYPTRHFVPRYSSGLRTILSEFGGKSDGKQEHSHRNASVF